MLLSIPFKSFEIGCTFSIQIAIGELTHYRSTLNIQCYRSSLSLIYPDWGVTLL